MPLCGSGEIRTRHANVDSSSGGTLVEPFDGFAHQIFRSRGRLTKLRRPCGTRPTAGHADPPLPTWIAAFWTFMSITTTFRDRPNFEYW